MQTEPEYVVGFLGSLDDLLQLVEDVAFPDEDLNYLVDHRADELPMGLRGDSEER